jgi:hypothetical protein
MAPITLQPDDSDTGWVIAGTVEFQGISQYVVTPADNPAHRRPVKKQHILDWISPKAYEDFEYAQYKRRIDEEREKESRIMAKAAAVRERIHGMGLAREGAMARKPFARYMQLEQVEDSDRGRISGHLSSPEHSPDESNGDILPGRVQSIKRKRSVRILQDKEPSVKRRGLSSSSKLSLVWKPWKPLPAKPKQQRQIETTEDENNTEDGSEAAPTIFSAKLKLPDTFNRPILPPPRRFTTPSRASMPQESSVSPYSAQAGFIPATVSRPRVPPKLHRRVLGPPIGVNVNIPKSALPPQHSRVTSPRKVNPVQPPNHGGVYPPILPPPKLSTPPAFKPISTTTHIGLNGFEGSSKRGRTKRKHHSLSPTDESTPAEEGSEVRGRSNSAKPERPDEKNSMRRSHFSDLVTSRGRQGSGNDKVPKPKEDNGSSSSGPSNVLRRPNHRQSPKLSNKQSKYFASMRMKQKSENDTEDDVGEESEETWEIHGILDDEMRRVNTRLVRHYLCDWVGDYEPTWEPEENISADALKKYEEGKKRNGFGFDGAADVKTMSENGEASNLMTLQRLDDTFGQDIEASDSEAFTDAAMFLTPDENPRSDSGAGSAAGEGIVVGAETL